MSSASELTDFYREKAEKELGETETKKAQALQQVREWIQLQPHIKNCRQDDIFLLRFLRARKYSFINATNTLENFLTSTKVFPQFYENLDIKNPVLEKLLDAGFLLSMPKRSKDGEKILLARPHFFDTTKYVGMDMFRTHMLEALSIFEEEETQISGYKYIVDFTGLSLDILGVATLTEYKNHINIVQNAFPQRLKSVYYVNLPGFANTVVQFIVSLLSEKIRGRVQYFKSFEELASKEDFDLELLPKEYGGTVPISNIIETMKETYLERRSAILESIETEIIVENIPKWAEPSSDELEQGAIGSFRKLDID